MTLSQTHKYLYIYVIPFHVVYVEVTLQNKYILKLKLKKIPIKTLNSYIIYLKLK